MQIKKEKTPEDFINMEQLELKYYSEEHVTPHQEAYLWHLSNPKTGFVLEDAGRIAAFTDILPVKNEIFDEIVKGRFDDKYLTTDCLVPMDDLKQGDKVNLLLSCVLVDEDYRETDALKTLLNAHLDYYRGYLEKGIVIDMVVTSNVTRAGERFSERMGFKRIGTSEHQTALYQIGFHELSVKVAEMKSRLENILFQAENSLLDPNVCRNPEFLEESLSEGFLEYGQTGKIYDKSAVIQQLLHGVDRKLEIQDFSMRCLSRNIAEVHYVAVGKEVPHTKSLRTSIWALEEGSWKLCFHQGTKIPDR